MVQESIPDQVYRIDHSDLPELTCPYGHHINVINSYITCNSTEVDIFEETWAICRNKTSCTLDDSIFKNCPDPQPEIKYVTYNCAKLHAFDCGLFYPYDKKDEAFCLLLCLYYMRDCSSKYDQVPRYYFLRCLEKMFFRNVVNECGFLPKYYLGQISTENKKWSHYKFNHKVENPIVFPSVPTDKGTHVKVLVNNVNNFGLSMRLVLMDCSGRCTENTTDSEDEIKFFAISTGNHSSNPDRQIVSGLIEAESNDVAKLPLDPTQEWIVLVQIQKVTLINSTESIRPVIYTSLTYHNNRYLVSFHSSIKGDLKKVLVGYLAIAKTKSNSVFLYQAELKYLSFFAQHVDKVDFEINLGPNFSHRAFFGTTSYDSTLASDTRQGVYSLGLKSTIRSPVNSGKKKYNMTLSLHWIVKNRTIHTGPRVDLVFVEKHEFTVIKHICMFTRRLNSNSKRSCYIECLTNPYLRDCLRGQTELFLSCYQSKSQNCEVMNLMSLINLIHENIGLILEYYDSIANKKTQSATPKAVPDAAAAASPPTNPDVSVSGSKNITKIDMSKLGPVYSKWSDWSECSSVCDDGIHKPHVRRTRLLYAESKIDEEVEIIEKRDCAHLPKCDKLCYYRNYAIPDHSTGTSNPSDPNSSGNTSKAPKTGKYYFIWNRSCVMKTEKAMKSKRHLGTKVKMANVLDFNEDCDKDYNWSACDAPCRSSSQQKEPHQHLMFNIKCPSNSRNCTLQQCPNKEDPRSDKLNGAGGNKSKGIGTDTKDKIENSMCLVYNTSYDAEGATWSSSGSCICPKDTVVCTSTEIHFNKSNQYILNNNYNSQNSAGGRNSLEGSANRGGSRVQEFISVADYERIVIPLGFVKVATYDRFKSEDELANFCCTGNIQFEKIKDELLLIDCSNIYNLQEDKMDSEDDKNTDCLNECNRVKADCVNRHKGIESKELIECYINYLKNSTSMGTDTQLIEALRIADRDEELIDAVCNQKKTIHSCKSTFTNVLNNCKSIQHHNNINIRARQCIYDHYESLRNNTGAKGSKGSGTECGFRKRKIVGNGLVFCKSVKCKYTEYYDWFTSGKSDSDSTEPEIGLKDKSSKQIELEVLNELRKIIKTNTITDDDIRAVIKHFDGKASIKIRYRNVVGNEKSCTNLNNQVQIYALETLETQVNPNDLATGEENKSSIITISPVDKNQEEQHSNSRNPYSALSSNTSQKNCDIYLGQKQLQNTKLIIQTNRCSCPVNTFACSIEESLNSRRWLRLLNLVCMNKMRSVLFSNSGNFYRFSCLSKSFIKEDFESIKQLCNEDDEMTFISCYGEPTMLEMYVKAAFMAILGVLSSVILLIYVNKRRTLFHFR